MSNKNILFQKYSIKVDPNTDEYIVKSYDEAGIKTTLKGELRKGVLSGRTVAGSIAFTKDKQQKSKLHILLKIGQILHEFFTGRLHKLNRHGRTKPGKRTYSNICHGMVIRGPAVMPKPKIENLTGNHSSEKSPVSDAGNPTGKSSPDEFVKFPVSDAIKSRYKEFRPMEYIDPLFPGIMHTNGRDVLRDVDTGKLYIYTPKDKNAAQLIADLAIASSVPLRSKKEANSAYDKLKYYDVKCLPEDKKIHFSVNKLLACLFRTPRRLAPKASSQSAINRSSLMLADLLMNDFSIQSIKEKNGHNRSYFCCSYVTTLLQAALFKRSLEGVDKEEIDAFMGNSDTGTPLSREELAKKIASSLLKGSRQDDEVGKALAKVFEDNKLVRMDGKYSPSLRVAEALDQASHAKKNEIPDLPHGQNLAEDYNLFAD